jgi:hypothetical protein
MLQSRIDIERMQAMGSKKLHEWMKAATPDEQHALAAAAKTSRSVLYQLCYPKEKGGRVASAELADRIETAAKPITAKSKGRLPQLTRGDLCPACAACPYFAKCGPKTD